MAGKAVRQRRGEGCEEIRRDALERFAIRARRNVGGFTGGPAVAKNSDGAVRSPVSGRRGYARDAVGNGRRCVGERRACCGGGAAQDRRAQGCGAGSPRATAEEAQARRAGSTAQLTARPKAL